MSASTPKYAAKSTIRSLKNFSKGYTDIQGKVREATSNDPWGPSGTQMNELARATFNEQEFLEIMEILDKRMNDKGKNWRHVFKALTVLDYLLHVGSENVVRYARENLYIVKTLKEFQLIDEDGKDQGSNVRQKAKDITALLSDEARLKEARRSRSAMRDRMSGRPPRESSGNDSRRERPDMTEEDRQLQRALEESRRMARGERGDRGDHGDSDGGDDDDLKKALALSKKEEQDRQKNLEKYNELSTTEDWDANAGSNNGQQESGNNDFFANDFGGNNHNNNNNNSSNDMFASMNNFDNQYLQSQPTGFNNPYLQFQQQQQQMEQQMEQQMLQQQHQQMLAQQQQQEQQQQMMLLQQQQQMQQMQQQQMFMNNPYQQQVMPQMTGAPSIGSNNPFSAFNVQKAASNQPFPDSFRTTAAQVAQNQNNINSNNSSSNLFGFNNNNSNNNSNALSELAFLQTQAKSAVPEPTSSVANKGPNVHDQKYAHLAMALQNREDGMDTFGNTGQLRIPSIHTMGAPVASHVTGASNPFQRTTINHSGLSNSLINIDDNNNNTNSNGFGGLVRSASNNPFQASSQQNGFQNNSSGAFTTNTLF
ncbi:hypothetical protein BGZ83_000467 [Gryganskiella cystojenkinii]|nr:hypothetical protein BGZ83_000467 [Gryganskiella cystojenkinii]